MFALLGITSPPNLNPGVPGGICFSFYLALETVVRNSFSIFLRVRGDMDSVRSSLLSFDALLRAAFNRAINVATGMIGLAIIRTRRYIH